MKNLFAATSVIALLAATPLIAAPAGSPDDMSNSNTQGAPTAGSTRNMNPGNMNPGNMNPGNMNPGANSPAGAQAASTADKEFVTKTAIGGLAEVQTGQLAEQNAADPKVKDYGRTLATDHAQANNDLQPIAAKLGVTLPAKLDEEHQQSYDKLSKLRGSQFDREFSREEVADHRKDIAEFKKEQASTQDPDLRAFTLKTLPVLQQHLATAESLQDALVSQASGGAAAGSGSSSDEAANAADENGTSGSSHHKHHHAASPKSGNASDNSETHQLNRDEAARIQSDSAK